MPGIADQQLRKAADSGDLAGVEQALKAGADVNARDEYNNTALNMAALWGHGEVVRALVDAGADIENKGSGGGLTPLANATSRGHFEVSKLLLDRGARVTDDLLAIVQTKLNILEENAEAGMVRPEGVEAWKKVQGWLLTERLRQDVPVMAAALTDPDERRGREATRALAEASRRGVDVAPAVEGLRSRLGDSDGDTREQASEALSRHLAFSGDAGGLRELLQAEDDRLQAGALSGVTYAARDAADVGAVVGAIATLLAHRIPDIRFNGALALAFAAKNGADVSEALPPLARLLTDGEAKVRRGTATAFSLMARSGVDVAFALPALQALVDDPDAGVSGQAAKAVAAVRA